MSELDELKDAIRKMHGCESEHYESVPITERFQDAIVWEGVVEVFTLIDHPTAKRCYAWKHKLDNGGERFVAVLKIPPADSARNAVRAAIASQARRNNP